jgi:hypothetical protein
MDGKDFGKLGKIRAVKFNKIISGRKFSKKLQVKVFKMDTNYEKIWVCRSQRISNTYSHSETVYLFQENQSAQNFVKKFLP